MAAPAQAQAYDEQGKPIAPGEVATAVREGRAYFDKGARVYARNPQGDLVSVAPEDAGAPGYSVVTPEELAEGLRKRRAETAGGLAKTAAEATVRGVTRGYLGPEQFYDEEGRKEAATRRSTHPNLATGFEVAGMLGSDLALSALGGGALATLGRGATPMRAASTLGRLVEGVPGLAARGALEGAAMGAGQQVSQATLENTPLTAERLLAGAWDGAKLGGAFGAGAGVLSGGLGTVGRRLARRLADEVPEVAAPAVAPAAASLEQASQRAAQALPAPSALPRFAELDNVATVAEAKQLKSAILGEMDAVRQAGGTYTGTLHSGFQVPASKLRPFLEGDAIDLASFSPASLEPAAAKAAAQGPGGRAVQVVFEGAEAVPMPGRPGEALLPPGKFTVLSRRVDDADGSVQITLAPETPPAPPPAPVVAPQKKPLVEPETLRHAGLGALAGVLTGSPLAGVATGAGLKIVRKLVEERGLDSMATLADRVSNVANRIDVAGKVAALGAAPKALAAPAAYATNKVFDKYSAIVNDARRDPAPFIKRMGEATADVAIRHPEVASQIQQTLMADLKYLDSIHPVSPSTATSSLTPLAVQTQVTYSYDQKNAFVEAATALDNPLQVFEQVARGDLPLSGINALKVRRPALFDEMRQAVIKHTAARAEQLPYSRRVLLGVAFDFQADWSMLHTSSIQESLKPPEAKQPGPSTSEASFKPGDAIAPGGF